MADSLTKEAGGRRPEVKKHPAEDSPQRVGERDGQRRLLSFE